MKQKIKRVKKYNFKIAFIQTQLFQFPLIYSYLVTSHAAFQINEKFVSIEIERDL